jgi:hypothetical protein
MNLDPEFLDTLTVEELEELKSEADLAVGEAQANVAALHDYMTRRNKIQAIQQIMSNFTPEEIAMAKKLAQSASVDGIESESATGWS